MAPTLVGSQYDYVILTVKITGWTMFKIHVYVISIASRDMLLYSLQFYIDLTMRDQKCLGIFFLPKQISGIKFTKTFKKLISN